MCSFTCILLCSYWGWRTACTNQISPLPHEFWGIKLRSLDLVPSTISTKHSSWPQNLDLEFRKILYVMRTDVGREGGGISIDTQSLGTAVVHGKPWELNEGPLQRKRKGKDSGGRYWGIWDEPWRTEWAPKVRGGRHHQRSESNGNEVSLARPCAQGSSLLWGKDRREMLPVSIPDRLTPYRRLDTGLRTSDPHKEPYHQPLAGQASRGQRLSLLASGFRSGSWFGKDIAREKWVSSWFLPGMCFSFPRQWANYKPVLECVSNKLKNKTKKRGKIMLDPNLLITAVIKARPFMLILS